MAAHLAVERQARTRPPLRPEFTIDGIPLQSNNQEHKVERGGQTVGVPADVEDQPKLEKLSRRGCDRMVRIARSAPPQGRSLDRRWDKQKNGRSILHRKYAFEEAKEPDAGEEFVLPPTEYCEITAPKSILKNRESKRNSSVSNGRRKDSGRTLDNLIRCRNESLAYKPERVRTYHLKYTSYTNKRDHTVEGQHANKQDDDSNQTTTPQSLYGAKENGCQGGMDSRQNVETRRHHLLRKLHNKRSISVAKCGGVEILERHVDNVDRLSEDMSSSENNCLAQRLPSPYVQRFSKRGLVRSKSCSNLLSKRKTHNVFSHVQHQPDERSKADTEQFGSVIDLSHNGLSPQVSPTNSCVKIRDFSLDIPSTKHNVMPEVLPALPDIRGDKDSGKKIPDERHEDGHPASGVAAVGNTKLVSSTARMKRGPEVGEAKNPSVVDSKANLPGAGDVSSRFSGVAESGAVSRLAVVQTPDTVAALQDVNPPSETILGVQKEDANWPGEVLGRLDGKYSLDQGSVDGPSVEGQVIYIRDFTIPTAPPQTPNGSSDTAGRESSQGSVHTLKVNPGPPPSNSTAESRDTNVDTQSGDEQIPSNVTTGTRGTTNGCKKLKIIWSDPPSKPDESAEDGSRNEVPSHSTMVSQVKQAHLNGLGSKDPSGHDIQINNAGFIIEKGDELPAEEGPELESMYNFPEESILRPGDEMQIVGRKKSITSADIKGADMREHGRSYSSKETDRRKLRRSLTIVDTTGDERPNMAPVRKARPKSVCTSQPVSMRRTNFSETEDSQSESGGDNLQYDRDMMKAMYDQSFYMNFQHSKFRKSRPKIQQRLSKKPKNDYRSQENIEQFLNVKIGGNDNSAVCDD